MKQTLTALLATALLCAVPACVQHPARIASGDPLEGTWKAVVDSIRVETRPSIYLLNNGVYSCRTCPFPLKLNADGAFHPVRGQTYFDSMAVTAVNDRTVKFIKRKGGRVIGVNTVTVMPDGNSTTFEFVDSTIPNARPVTGEGTETRIGAAPPGSHIISGSWKVAERESISKEGLVFTFDIDGDTLHMTGRSGVSYNATFGGPEVPIIGDPGGTTIRVKRLAPNRIREVSSRKGQVVNVTTYTVTRGRMTTFSENTLQGSTMRYSAFEQ